MNSPKLNTVFVGHFTPLSSLTKNIYSAAGSLTQQEIINSLENIDEIGKVESFVMVTQPSWPKGPFWSTGYKMENLHASAYLNLFLVRNVWFSIKLFFYLLKVKPNFCLQYNSFFFENLAMLLYRFFYEKARLVMIIQDIKCSTGNNYSLAALLEKGGILFAKKFDFLVPISQSIIDDFGLNKERSVVFQGGVTGESLNNLTKIHQKELDEIAVFAGALEYYNGVDVLVKRWSESKVKTVLHVFGRGTLEELISVESSKSDNIIFHGFCSENDVIKYQAKAKWLISLRYSKGLDQNYFFPSKFFNLLAQPGNVLVNRFNNIPGDLAPYLVFIDDDLVSLSDEFLQNSDHAGQHLPQRLKLLQDKHSWDSLIKEITHKSNLCNA